MSNEFLLILDDASGQFNYSGGEWTLSTLVEWFNGTSYYPAFAGDGTHFGSFNLTFEGKSCTSLGSIRLSYSKFRNLYSIYWQYTKPVPFVGDSNRCYWRRSTLQYHIWGPQSPFIYSVVSITNSCRRVPYYFSWPPGWNGRWFCTY